MPANLTVQLAPARKPGLRLANPVMTASGTFGYGTEYRQIFDIQRLGAIICKGTTLKPREGNPQPRLVETASGVINSIGLQNIGVKAVIREMAPVWAGWQVPVIVNIAGDTVEEYARLARELDGVAGRVAAAVAEAGADAVSLINSVRAMAIDIAGRRPAIGNTSGGLSGPAIKPLALSMVYDVAGAVDIPVIGCGGIANGADALEFIMAGASAVQVGSATFANPRASLDVLEGIRRFLEQEGIKSLKEIIGIARR